MAFFGLSDRRRRELHVRRILSQPPGERSSDDLEYLERAVVQMASETERESFFSRFDPAVRREILEAMTMRRIVAGEVLFEAGEPGAEFFVVLSGTVGVFQTAKVDAFSKPEARLAYVPSLQERMEAAKETAKTSGKFARLRKAADRGGDAAWQRGPGAAAGATQGEQQREEEEEEEEAVREARERREEAEEDVRVAEQRLNRATEPGELKQATVGLAAARKALDRLRSFARGKCVATLGPGNSFGEMALIHGQPRVATIAAMDQPVELMVLSKRAFDRTIKADEERHARAKVNFLNSLPVLASVHHSSFIRGRFCGFFKPCKFARGSRLCTQEEGMDTAYFITQGTVDVRHRGAVPQPAKLDLVLDSFGETTPEERPGAQKLRSKQPSKDIALATFGEGMAIGLEALVTHLPSLYTATATSDVSALSITRIDFFEQWPKEAIDDAKTDMALRLARFQAKIDQALFFEAERGDLPAPVSAAHQQEIERRSPSPPTMSAPARLAPPDSSDEEDDNFHLPQTAVRTGRIPGTASTVVMGLSPSQYSRRLLSKAARSGRLPVNARIKHNDPAVCPEPVMLNVAATAASPSSASRRRRDVDDARGDLLAKVTALRASGATPDNMRLSRPSSAVRDDLSALVAESRRRPQSAPGARLRQAAAAAASPLSVSPKSLHQRRATPPANRFRQPDFSL